MKHSRTEVKVESDQLALTEVDGEPVMMEKLIVRPGDERTLTFTGEHQVAGQMPAAIKAVVKIKIAPEE